MICLPCQYLIGGPFTLHLVTMIFKASLVWSVLALAATALPSALHISNKQPPPAYPIGQGKGSNAKVSGRVFNIDGKKGYFAGELRILSCHPHTIPAESWPLTNLWYSTGSNAWWLAHLSNNDDIDIALSQVAKVRRLSRLTVEVG